MNKENFRSIVISLKPENIYLNNLDFILVLMLSFDRDLDIITDEAVIQTGVVANYFESRIWITYPEIDVERNFIKIAQGDSINFDDMNWSLPICLDWHLNDINRMWNLKAFW